MIKNHLKSENEKTTPLSSLIFNHYTNSYYRFSNWMILLLDDINLQKINIIISIELIYLK